MRLLTALLLATAFTAPAWADGASDGPSTRVLEQVAPAIVEILTSGCAGHDSERAASGFVWGDHGVVTDLHVVADCAKVIVSFQDLGEFPATVAHVLPTDDLVLLDVAGAPHVTGLVAADRAPIVGERLDAFGYPLGVPRRDTMPLSVSFATQESPLLYQGLSPGVRAELQAQGIPSLDVQVLHLVGGNLVPGHSGAPLIDWQGRVLGIGSGGLSGGSVGIGWAVRAQYLAGLPAAGDSMPALGPAAAGSFDFPVAGSGGATPPGPAPPPAPVQAASAQTGFAYAVPNRGSQDAVTCGALTLYRTRTATLGKVAASSDDPDRIEALAQDVGGVKLDELGETTATIWTELASGAAIVVPQGARIAAGDPFCTVLTTDPGVTMLVRFARLPMQTATVAWDVARNKLEHQSFSETDSVSQSGITYRGHGLVSGPHLVNGAEVQRRLGEANPSGGRQVRLYRADLAGRGAYALVAAIALDLPDNAPAATRLAWAESVMAVHLSSFPPRFGDAATQGLQPLARTYPQIRCGDDAISPLGEANGLTTWTEPKFGYAIPLPTGATPQPQGDVCVATGGDPAVRFVIRTVDQRTARVAKGRDWRTRMAAEAAAFPATLSRLAGADLAADGPKRRSGDRKDGVALDVTLRAPATTAAIADLRPARCCTQVLVGAITSGGAPDAAVRAVAEAKPALP